MNNFYRKKLINAIKYFAKNTKRLNYTKLFKLLYFFDFEHFKQTGYPAIGLKYYTFQNGPVPKDLWLQLKDGKVPEDFKQDIGINIESRNELDPAFKEFQIKAKLKSDTSVFTPRELKILENLSLIYQYSTATEMSKISHDDEMPWAITKEKSGLHSYIDYMLALSDNKNIPIEVAKELLTEHFEMVENFDLNPV